MRKPLKPRNTPAASKTGAKSSAEPNEHTKMEPSSWAAEPTSKKRRKRRESEEENESQPAEEDTFTQYNESPSDSSGDEETTATDLDATARSGPSSQTPAAQGVLSSQSSQRSLCPDVELGHVILFVATDSAVRTLKAPFIHLPLLSLPKHFWEGKSLDLMEKERTRMLVVPLNDGGETTLSPCALFTLADADVESKRVSAASALCNLTFRSWVAKRKGISVNAVIQELSHILPVRLTRQWGYQQIGSRAPQELLVPGQNQLTELVITN